MSEAGSSRRRASTVWSFLPLAFLVILGLIVLYGSLQLQRTRFTNEYVWLSFIIVVLAVEVIDVHILVSALLRITELGIRAEESHSFGLHLCHDDRRQCYRWRGKAFPMCARHMGYYGCAVVLFLTALVFPAVWVSFADALQPNISLAIGLVLIIIVSVEGNLGKSGHLHLSKNVRFLNGMLTALAYPFLIIALARTLELL